MTTTTARTTSGFWLFLTILALLALGVFLAAGVVGTLGIIVGAVTISLASPVAGLALVAVVGLLLAALRYSLK